MATPGINVVGMTMLLQFVVSFGFILVVNAPQNMVAYGTDTFEARDFVRTGLVLTVIALGAGDAAGRDVLALAGLRVRRAREAASGGCDCSWSGLREVMVARGGIGVTLASGRAEQECRRTEVPICRE